METKTEQQKDLDKIIEFCNAIEPDKTIHGSRTLNEGQMYDLCMYLAKYHKCILIGDHHYNTTVNTVTDTNIYSKTYGTKYDSFIFIGKINRGNGYAECCRFYLEKDLLKLI